MTGPTEQDASKPHVGFVIEQALGHVAYGMGLQRSLARRDDMSMEWMPIPYAPGSLDRLPLLGTNWTVRGSLRARRAVLEAHGARKLDALFVHTQTISLGLHGFMGDVPTVVSLDATPRNFDEFSLAYGSKPMHRRVEDLKLSVHRAVMRRVACFVAWSDWTRRSLVDDYGVEAQRIVTIHPGTNLDNFPDPAGRAARPGRPLQVLFVGGDFVRKGGDLLLRACRTLRGQVELHVVTQGHEQVRPEPGVHVYGDLKPLTPALLQRFHEADVFVLPTRADCLANVLGEAMASGLPIITTRVGAHPEAIEEGHNGFLVDVDDEAALAARLALLAQDRDLCARMGRESRRIGTARFDMDKGAKRIGDILVGLAQGSNSLHCSC